MMPGTAMFRAEHRGFEMCLDKLAGAISAGQVEAARAAWFEARRAGLAHYDHEEASLFPALEPRFPALVAKMRGQHEEAREIAGHLDDRALPEAEWMGLARRFLAIAQHNIIEEERDLFALAGAAG
jgi:hypothetical protein